MVWGDWSNPKRPVPGKYCGGTRGRGRGEWLRCRKRLETRVEDGCDCPDILVHSWSCGLISCDPLPGGDPEGVCKKLPSSTRYLQKDEKVLSTNRT